MDAWAASSLTKATQAGVKALLRELDPEEEYTSRFNRVEAM